MSRTRFVPTSLFLLLTVLIAALVMIPTTPTPADGPKGEPPQKPKDSEKGSHRDDSRHRKPFKPVQSVERMMKGQEKLFDDLKDALLDKEWDDARVIAWLLAELANVNHYQSENPQYHAFADQMSQDCIELAKVLKKRDMKAATAAASQVGESCNSCHDAFKKKHGQRGRS